MWRLATMTPLGISISPDVYKRQVLSGPASVLAAEDTAAYTADGSDFSDSGDFDSGSEDPAPADPTPAEPTPCLLYTSRCV